MAEESSDYLRGKVAGLELINGVLLNLLVEVSTSSLSGETDLRIQFAAQITSTSAEMLRNVALPNDLFRQGLGDAMSEFSSKLLS